MAQAGQDDAAVIARSAAAIVKYRVQRAIERRGRPISDGRLDVEVALLLCHWYGSAVLTDPA